MHTKEQTGTGRHRDPRRSFGPLALGLLVLALLGGLGAGAALLPSSFVGGSGDAGQSVIAGTDDRVLGADASASDGSAAPLQADAQLEPSPTAPPVASPTATAAPSPGASRTTTPPKKAKPSPTRSRSTGGGATAVTGSEQEKVVAEVNRQRAAGGCGAVKVNAKLTQAAQLHSEDQADHNNMSHTGSDGSTPWDRAGRAGYDNAIGENVAMGYRDAAAVMEGWMNSPGHRANIMNCDAKAIGVGIAKSSGGSLYWTQLFGSVV